MRWDFALAGALLALGAVVACGGDDDGGGSGGSSSGGGGAGGTSGGGGGTGGSSTGGGGTSTGGTGGGAAGSGGSAAGAGGGSGISLAAADKPAVTPCPSQDLLTDTTKFPGLQTALKTGVISYLDIPYSASDPDILKKKCGLDAYWNPADNTDAIPVTGAPSLATILTTGNGGICSAGFKTFGTDEGFPVAGTYRKEFKAASGGKTYHVRARIEASGSAAGSKFSAQGVAVPNDIKSTLVYKVGGKTIAHDDLWTGILDAMSAPAPAVKLDVEKGGTTIFSANIALICAAES